MTPDELIAVWLEAGESRWFTKNAVFDGMRCRRSIGLREARWAFDHWTATARGSLGLVLLLDQVSRNIHRNSALAFAGDARALAVAKASVARGDHQSMPPPLAMWLVMPFDHAETSIASGNGLSPVYRWDWARWPTGPRCISTSSRASAAFRTAMGALPPVAEEVAFPQVGGLQRPTETRVAIRQGAVAGLHAC